MKKEIMVIGFTDEDEEVCRKILSLSRELYNINYVEPETDIKIIFRIADRVEQVFICSSVDSNMKSQIISYCIGRGKEAYVVPKLYDILMAKSKVSQFDDVPVFKLSSLGLTIEQRFIKRAFDLVVSLMGLIIAAPLIVIVVLAIKLDSEGPVFYLQERVTMSGRLFKLIKFRTMVTDAEKDSGPMLALKTDPRITRIGHFIRATRLDEIPQLINVLKGEMSIIGPRPERQFFIEKFKKEISYYDYRHSVKAGITGAAQVYGKYSTSAADKFRYDLMYITSYSFLQDLKILFQTIKIVFMKESSSGVETGEITTTMDNKSVTGTYAGIGVTLNGDR